MAEPIRGTPGTPPLPVYERPRGLHPPLDFPGYRSTSLRAPSQPLVLLPHNLTEVTGPLLGAERVRPTDNDLTVGHEGEALGQRIIVSGRVLDSDGRAVPDALVEVWQANAAGRYRHAADQWPAPLDPNFTGLGRVLTDARVAIASPRSSRVRIHGATTTTRGVPHTSISRCSAGHSPSVS